MPKYSIIIPVYNSEKYLKKCIDSVLNQSYDDYEIIAINDKSNDNSEKILKEYGNKINLHNVKEKNGVGPSHARNIGIKMAKGDYILFLDSDDYYKKDLLRIALTYPHVYVGTVCLGANPNQLIKVLKEANNYNGPSIVIAYAPCISHGITGGMENSIEIEKQAVSCGYYPLFHYMPDVGFTLDSKNVDFNDYSNFIERQTRFNALKKVNPSEANELLEYNINEAKKRFYYYESLDKK